MGLVAVENIKEGSILSADVRDVNGRLMLSRGQPVYANHIRIFKLWGVSAVEIYGSVAEQDLGDLVAENDRSDLDLARWDKAEKTVRSILCNADLNDPCIAMVYREAVRYRYQKKFFLDFSFEGYLPEGFKLNLAQGLRTQIRFVDLQLPEAPGIVMEFTRVVDDPQASAEDIAEVINRSSSLTALLLKVANSPIFGLSARVDTVTRAVSMMGVREIGSLVLSVSLMRLFFDIPKELVDMRSFLRHSLACGLLARIIAAHKKLVYTEQMFVAGLLHDIGRLVFYRYFPEQAKLLLRMAVKIGWSLYDMEREVLGIDHQKLAQLLIDKWNLPSTLKNKIVYHHCAADSPERMAAGIIQLADLSVNALGLGHSGETNVPRVDPVVCEELRLPPGVFKTAMAQTVEQIGVMEALFAEL